jgi:sulfotransferase family protein
MMESETPSTVLTGVPAPTLQVIGAGFGRTGTTSLREALVRLGFAPCDHMDENFARPERFVLWREAFERKQAGEPIDWRPLLANYRAIVDWPGAHFWRDLTSSHPEAKVILTVRDPDRWYASILTTIFNFRTRVRDGDDLLARVRLLLLRLGMLGTKGGLQFIDDLIWQGTFDGRVREREYALRIFSEHNQTVQETIPADRLLVFDVKQGWEPLCQFLGVPVPAGEPFPHLSDTSSAQKLIRELYWDGARRAGAIAASAILGLLVLAWQGRRTHGYRRPV